VVTRLQGTTWLFLGVSALLPPEEDQDSSLMTIRCPASPFSDQVLIALSRRFAEVLAVFVGDLGRFSKQEDKHLLDDVVDEILPRFVDSRANLASQLPAESFVTEALRVLPLDASFSLKLYMLEQVLKEMQVGLIGCQCTIGGYQCYSSLPARVSLFLCSYLLGTH
jgi:hypothetical protein